MSDLLYNEVPVVGNEYNLIDYDKKLTDWTVVTV